MNLGRWAVLYLMAGSSFARWAILAYYGGAFFVLALVGAAAVLVVFR
jgi:hypothetical protein